MEESGLSRGIDPEQPQREARGGRKTGVNNRGCSSPKVQSQQAGGHGKYCNKEEKEEIKPEKVTIHVGHHLHDSAMTKPITGDDNKADRVANKMWKERAYNRRHIATIDPIWHPDIKNEERNGNRKDAVTEHHDTVLLNTPQCVRCWLSTPLVHARSLSAELRTCAHMRIMDGNATQTKEVTAAQLAQVGENITTRLTWSLSDTTPLDVTLRGRLDELHHVIGVGDHRHVVRRDFDGGGTHAPGEQTLGIGWDGLIAIGDQIPGRERFPGRDTHYLLEGGRGQRLLHGVHDPGLDRIHVSGEVVHEVVLWQPGEALLVDDEVRQCRGHRSLRQQRADRFTLVKSEGRDVDQTDDVGRVGTQSGDDLAAVR